MSDKTPNYTEEQTAELVDAYTDADSQGQRDKVVNEFADKFGKSVRSIRQKLVREGVYVRKEYKSKTGEKPEQKSAIVADIENILAVDAGTLSGLDLATKKALQVIRAQFRALASMVEDANES